jgi:hypothetical protein
MTDAALLRWTFLLAVASAPSACAIERAVVATLESAGAAGAENGGSAGATAAPAGQVSTLAGGGIGGTPQATPPVSAGGGSDSGDSGGAPMATASGGASGLERAVGGKGGSAPRNVGGEGGSEPGNSGGASDCLNEFERVSAGGAGGTDSSAPDDMACACLGEAPMLLCGADGVTYSALCGSACPTVEIACLHECPCDDGETEPSTMMLWFLPESNSHTRCSDGFACIGFSPQGALESSCITVPTGS